MYVCSPTKPLPRPGRMRKVTKVRCLGTVDAVMRSLLDYPFGRVVPLKPKCFGWLIRYCLIWREVLALGSKRSCWYPPVYRHHFSA